VSDFTAKRLYIIAQGFYEALGEAHPKHALKAASEALGWRQRVSTIQDSDVRSTERINTPSPEQTRRTPPSGRVLGAPYPGLKPWAVVLSRFAAKPTHTEANMNPGFRLRRSAFGS